MHELDLFFTKPDGFNWTSYNIEEWTGKEHFNIMRDIRDEISKLEEAEASGVDLPKKPGDYFKFIESTNTGAISNAYFKISKAGVMQISSRYSAVIRANLIQKVEDLSKQLQDIQLHKHHAETYKQCMKTVYELSPKDEKNSSTPACKSASVVNKTVSTIFGFKTSINKPDMTPEMLTIRTQVQAKYEEIFRLTGGDNSLTTDMIYGVYVPVLMEDRLKKNLKKLEAKKKLK